MLCCHVQCGAPLHTACVDVAARGAQEMLHHIQVALRGGGEWGVWSVWGDFL